MAKPLRYTGCWPPVEILEKYPNWVFALDEEGEPDQDEATIKPESQQTFISDETDFSVATVTLANGMITPGILTFLSGKIDNIAVFNGHDWWQLQADQSQKHWSPVVDTSLPQEQRGPIVSPSDPLLFPARVSSCLPVGDGPRINFVVALHSGTDRQVRRPWYKVW